jgi:hypothetical protein
MFIYIFSEAEMLYEKGLKLTKEFTVSVPGEDATSMYTYGKYVNWAPYYELE